MSETCNDQDDDCDGMIDEGLAAASEPVVVHPALHARGINMVAGNGQFILVSDSTEHFITQTGQASAELDLNIDYTSGRPALAYDGAQLLVGVSGGPLTSRLGTPWSADYGPGASLLLSATRSRVTAYTLGQRSELDTSSGTGATESAHQTVGAGPHNIWNWAGVRAGADELVLLGAELWQTDTASGGAPSLVGLVTSDTEKVVWVAIAVRNPDASVSPTNPAAVVYMLSDSSHFAEITSLRPFVIGAPRLLATSTGWPSAEDSTVGVIAAPHGDRESAPGHWYVVTAERVDNPADPTGQTDAVLHVWEISASHPEGSLVTVPQNDPAYGTSIAVANLDGTIRVAGESSVGLSTRGIGCHF